MHNEIWNAFGDNYAPMLVIVAAVQSGDDSDGCGGGCGNDGSGDCCDESR